MMTWVRSVTVRTAIRLARQHDLEVAAEGTLVGCCASSLDGLVDIADALARLPSFQPVVLVLRTREGLSEQEIATTLGSPTGTVKSRLHRARAAFREAWESRTIPWRSPISTRSTASPFSRPPCPVPLLGSGASPPPSTLYGGSSRTWNRPPPATNPASRRYVSSSSAASLCACWCRTPMGARKRWTRNSRQAGS